MKFKDEALLDDMILAIQKDLIGFLVWWHDKSHWRVSLWWTTNVGPKLRNMHLYLFTDYTINQMVGTILIYENQKLISLNQLLTT